MTEREKKSQCELSHLNQPFLDTTYILSAYVASTALGTGDTKMCKFYSLLSQHLLSSCSVAHGYISLSGANSREPNLLISF